jgi:peptide/nickel transport system substrate-binding protein
MNLTPNHDRRALALVMLLAALMVACGGIARTVAPASPESDTGQPSEAPTDTPPPTEPPFKEELVICTSQEPEGLIGSRSYAAGLVWQALADQLALTDTAYGALTEALVELPTVDNGGLVEQPDGVVEVRLKLRDDLTWSDGEPVTANDVLLGLRAAGSDGFGPLRVREAEAADKTSVIIRLKRMGAVYPYLPDAPPLPVHTLGDTDAEAIASSQYAHLPDPTAGPYVMREWTPGESILLEANSHYAGDGPLIGKVRFRFVPDAETALADLSGGACDVVTDDLLDSIRKPQLDALQADGSLRVCAGPGALWEHVDFNTHPDPLDEERVPFFADVRVRQAVAYAVNRETMAASATSGISGPLDSWLPPAHWAYPPDGAGLTRYEYNPDQARALLAEAGWRDDDGDGVIEYHGEGGLYPCQPAESPSPDVELARWEIAEGTPFEVTLVTSADDDMRQAVAEQIKNDLAAVGIRVDVQSLPDDEMFASTGPLVRRRFDMALYAWLHTPDPLGQNLWMGADLYRHPLELTIVHDWEFDTRWLRSSVETVTYTSIPSADNDYVGQNYPGWCDEAANRALYLATSSLDLTERAQAYAEQQAIFTQQVPALPLFDRPRIAASAAYVCGIQMGPANVLIWNVGTWYFDETGQCQD